MDYLKLNPLNPAPYHNFVPEDKGQQKVFAAIVVFTVVLIVAGTIAHARQKKWSEETSGDSTPNS